MKRRDFFRNGTLATAGLGLLGSTGVQGRELFAAKGEAKNIIFLVSDGMSIGTLTMADQYSQRKFGRHTKWIQLYKEQMITRALMDTASLDSLVTDSAAGGSSWGGGHRVNNGSLNVGPNGENHKPILQKFKDAGKAVGCVTTVPITHATPASFCINHKTRNAQPLIAEKYLPLKFDVMMGGGTEHFVASGRKDGKDLAGTFEKEGYQVMQSMKDWGKIDYSKPLLGFYHKDAMPYALDHEQDADMKSNIPSLAEMTGLAIKKLNQNPNGFVMQVEGGKVDWAAHANDAAAIINDQLAFDEAVKTAVDFAEQDGNTLVVITTDHGNANPGLMKGEKANSNFDRFLKARHTNDWVLRGLNQKSSTSEIIERFEFAQGITFSKDDAETVRKHYSTLSDDELYNPRKLPFHTVAELQRPHNSVGWASDNHTSDFVELAMYGPGSDKLLPFVKNTDLHNFMLETTGVNG